VANPRDLALPDVATLDRLVASVVAEGRDECWGNMVTLLATTAMRISEVSGLTVGDVDLAGGIIHVQRQTYPGRGLGDQGDERSPQENDSDHRSVAPNS